MEELREEVENKGRSVSCRDAVSAANNQPRLRQVLILFNEKLTTEWIGYEWYNHALIEEKSWIYSDSVRHKIIRGQVCLMLTNNKHKNNHKAIVEMIKLVLNIRFCDFFWRHIQTLCRHKTISVWGQVCLIASQRIKSKGKIQEKHTIEDRTKIIKLGICFI